MLPALGLSGGFFRWVQTAEGARELERVKWEKGKWERRRVSRSLLSGQWSSLKHNHLIRFLSSSALPDPLKSLASLEGETFPKVHPFHARGVWKVKVVRGRLPSHPQQKSTTMAVRRKWINKWIKHSYLNWESVVHLWHLESIARSELGIQTIHYFQCVVKGTFKVSRATVKCLLWI